VTIHGHLIMPDVNQTNARYSKEYIPLNGYAFLSALDHLMSLKKNGIRFRQQMSPTLFIDTKEAPFDHVHLYSRQDDSGVAPANYYKHCMHSAAQNVLSFVMNDTVDFWRMDTDPAMYALYSNIEHKEYVVIKPYPERIHRYMTTGVKEYALPMDDILRYVTTLLFERMDSFFKNEPTEDQAVTLMRELGLDMISAEELLCSNLPEFINTATVTKGDVFGITAKNFWEMFEKQCDADAVTIGARAAAMKAGFKEKLLNVLIPYFTSPKYGPIWVKHMLVHYVNPRLLVMEKNYFSLLDACKRKEHDCEVRRNDLAANWLKTDRKAVEYADLWNQQLSIRRWAIVLRELFQESGQEPSIVEYARGVITEQNNKWFDVVAEILTALRRVSQQNVEIVATAKLTQPGVFSWGVIEVPQISDMIKAQFENLHQTKDLVKEFTVALLQKADEWAAGSVDVAAFLEEYFQKNLREIVSETMEAYLTDILVNRGPYHTLAEGLQALFDYLKAQATPMLWCTADAPDNAKQYLLSVPASCANIVAAAKAYKAAAGDVNVVVQLSKVDSRICMQSVRCAIPMYAYAPLADYEREYYLSTPEARRGCRLYEAGEVNWERLPSPIPRRKRPNLEDASLNTIIHMEGQRVKDFYALLKTPALKLVAHDAGNDYDCVFYPSQRLDESRVHEIWQDEKLKDYDGEWDRQKITAAVNKLEAYQKNGLPAEPSKALNLDGSTQPVEIKILESCLHLANAELSAPAYKNMLDGPEKEAKRREIALRQAVEYYLGSMPTCEKGKKELEKYATLETEIQRLKGIIARMDQLPKECKEVVKLRLTGQVVLSDDWKKFLYKKIDGQLTDDITMVCGSPLVEEWELLLRLREFEEEANPHKKALAERLKDTAEKAYDDMLKSKDRSKLEELKAGIARETARVTACRTDHTNALATGSRAGTVYSGKSLAFYDTLAVCLGEMENEVEFALSRLPSFVPTPVPAPAPVLGKACIRCGKELSVDVKFCHYCGAEQTSGNACIHCGKELPVGAMFCQHCGKKQTPEMSSCVSCGKELPTGAMFCQYCGAEQTPKEQTSGNACIVCGKELPAGAKFCYYCGGKQF